jgi:hypothetical protein
MTPNVAEHGVTIHVAWEWLIANANRLSGIHEDRREWEKRMSDGASHRQEVPR